MSLIYKKELKEWVENWFYQNKYYHPYSKSNNIPCSELYDILERIPTINAVQVVRCKDCRWACLAPKRQTATCMKARLHFTHGYDWFCADGERK